MTLSRTSVTRSSPSRTMGVRMPASNSTNSSHNEITSKYWIFADIMLQYRLSVKI